MMAVGVTADSSCANYSLGAVSFGSAIPTKPPSPEPSLLVHPHSPLDGSFRLTSICSHSLVYDIGMVYSIASSAMDLGPPSSGLEPRTRCQTSSLIAAPTGARAAGGVQFQRARALLIQLTGSDGNAYHGDAQDDAPPTQLPESLR